MLFRSVRLALKYCSYSTIMPQKRNPVAVETLRMSGDWAYATLSSMFNGCKAFTPGNGREPGFVISGCIQIAEKIIDTTYLFAGMVSSLEVDKARCRQLAEEGFSSMTDLADLMVRDKGVSFSAAKKIVGKLVVTAVNSKVKCSDISPKMVDDAAMEIIKRTVGLSEAEINEVLDAEKNVNRRNTTGSPSFSQVRSMIVEGKEEFFGIKNSWQQRENLLRDGSQKLNELSNSYIV